MNEENIINQSRFGEINEMNLEDFIPESNVKLYPYINKNIDVSNPSKNDFLEAGKISIIPIDQEHVAFNHLELDEDGNKYLKVFTIANESTQNSFIPATNNYKKTVKKCKYFKMLTNNYLDNDNKHMFFFTIGEAFNESKFITGEQTIYYMTNTAAATAMDVDDLSLSNLLNNDDIEQKQKITQFNLAELDFLEKRLPNCRIILTQRYINLAAMKQIKLKLLATDIIGSIQGKGKTIDSGEIEDIDFKLYSSNLMPFHIIPVKNANSNKLSFFCPWIDDQITLEKKIVDDILAHDNKMKFSDFCNKWGLSKDSRKLITEMILFTYQFNQNFKTIPTSFKSGQLSPFYMMGCDPDLTTGQGNIDTYISSVAKDNPKKVISGLYENWKKNHPDLLFSGEYNLVKAVIISLSNYINSEISIGGGNNDFNKAVLPWTMKIDGNFESNIKTTIFQTEEPIDPSDKDPKSPKIKLKILNLKDFDITILYNQYFTTSEKVIVNKKDLDLSNAKFLNNIENPIIIPELPIVLNPKDTITKTGDISTNTNKDLKYIVNLPLNNAESHYLLHGKSEKSTVQKIKTKRELPIIIASKIKKKDYKKGVPSYEKIKDEIIINYYDKDSVEISIKEQVKKMYTDANKFKFLNLGHKKDKTSYSNYGIDISFDALGNLYQEPRSIGLVDTKISTAFKKVEWDFWPNIIYNKNVAWQQIKRSGDFWNGHYDGWFPRQAGNKSEYMEFLNTKKDYLVKKIKKSILENWIPNNLHEKQILSTDDIIVKPADIVFHADDATWMHATDGKSIMEFKTVFYMKKWRCYFTIKRQNWVGIEFTFETRQGRKNLIILIKCMII